MNVIEQIIKLKEKYNLIERDATYEGQREWYEWAIANGHCEVVTNIFGKVIGFLEWVRLKSFPTDSCHFELDHSCMSNAPIAFVGNAYAKNAKVLRQLKNMAMRKQDDAQWLCWHSKRRNKINIFKMRRFA